MVKIEGEILANKTAAEELFRMKLTFLGAHGNIETRTRRHGRHGGLPYSKHNLVAVGTYIQ